MTTADEVILRQFVVLLPALVYTLSIPSLHAEQRIDRNIYLDVGEAPSTNVVIELISFVFVPVRVVEVDRATKGC